MGKKEENTKNSVNLKIII